MPVDLEYSSYSNEIVGKSFKFNMATAVYVFKL